MYRAACIKHIQCGLPRSCSLSCKSNKYFLSNIADTRLLQTGCCANNNFWYKRDHVGARLLTAGIYDNQQFVSTLHLPHYSKQTWRVGCFQKENYSLCNRPFFFNISRTLHVSASRLQDVKIEDFKVLEEKSKVEEFIEHQQKETESRAKVQEQLRDAFIFKADRSLLPDDGQRPGLQSANEETIVKSSIVERIKDEVKHYYNGFRLLYLDIKIALRLLNSVLNGKALTRRERKQFLRTVADMFRLVPFTVFLIIPFMEFLLPFAIKLFPGMLPSTFEDRKTKESKRRASLKVKLQMAEFLQDTIEEIAVRPENKSSNKKLKAFGDFVQKIRSEGEAPSNEQILKYSKLFKDEITLENIPHAQLKALCRLLMMSPIGPSNLLRLKIEFKLQELKRDDKIIRLEGIDALNTEELQTACIARGMRAVGVQIEQLKSNLKQWLELSLDNDIPASLLLLSRTLYMGPTVTDQLKVAISQFPERLIDEMEVKIGAVEQEEVDRQTIIDIIEHEEKQIKAEKKETEEKKQKEELLPEPEKDISKEELLNVMETLSTEREELHKIKEDRDEYIEDVAEMKQVKESSKETIASRLLGSRVDAMLKKIDGTLGKLEEDVSNLPKGVIDKDKDGKITTSELFQAIQAIRNVPSEAKTKRFIEALDEDQDGEMSLDELKTAIELLATEDLDLNSALIAEVVALLKGTEKIYIIEQMLTKKKTNYILRLLPIVYARKNVTSEQ